jgi:hypothetical protein
VVLRVVAHALNSERCMVRMHSRSWCIVFWCWLHASSLATLGSVMRRLVCIVEAMSHHLTFLQLSLCFCGYFINRKDRMQPPTVFNVCESHILTLAWTPVYLRLEYRSRFEIQSFQSCVRGVPTSIKTFHWITFSFGILKLTVALVMLLREACYVQLL